MTAKERDVTQLEDAIIQLKGMADSAETIANMDMYDDDKHNAAVKALAPIVADLATSVYYRWLNIKPVVNAGLEAAKGEGE